MLWVSERIRVFTKMTCVYTDESATVSSGIAFSIISYTCSLEFFFRTSACVPLFVSEVKRKLSLHNRLLRKYTHVHFARKTAGKLNPKMK